MEKRRFINEKARILSRIRINVGTGCWEWTGATAVGYGRIKIEKTLYGVHRVMYEIENGDIPEKMYVCHSCDNRRCCNPGHLFLGTCKENMIDASIKGRLPIQSKTTREEALIVAKSVVSNCPKETFVSIAKRHGINDHVLYRIRKGILHKGVMEEALNQ